MCVKLHSDVASLSLLGVFGIEYPVFRLLRTGHLVFAVASVCFADVQRNPIAFA